MGGLSSVDWVVGSLIHSKLSSSDSPNPERNHPTLPSDRVTHQLFVTATEKSLLMQVVATRHSFSLICINMLLGLIVQGTSHIHTIKYLTQGH
jgi:hypothetical protein